MSYLLHRDSSVGTGIDLDHSPRLLGTNPLTAYSSHQFGPPFAGT
jgi:hypothetical protein